MQLFEDRETVSLADLPVLIDRIQPWRKHQQTEFKHQQTHCNQHRVVVVAFVPNHCTSTMTPINFL
jgi:hypothetical protein